MSMQMLKTKIKSLGARPLGDTEDELRKQLAALEQPEPESEPEPETEPPETEPPESEKDTVDLPAPETESNTEIPDDEKT